MGVFDGLFGKKNKTEKAEEKTLPWIPLTALDQLIDIQKKSQDRPQVIFKHSTTCGISRMVLNGFGSTYSFDKDQIDLYFLDLHSYREVSNEVGFKFQVMHQSPQLLVIKNGVVVAHDSHGAISRISLEEYL